jgi:hypothetical protein
MNRHIITSACTVTVLASQNSVDKFFYIGVRILPNRLEVEPKTFYKRYTNYRDMDVDLGKCDVENIIIKIYDYIAGEIVIPVDETIFNTCIFKRVYEGLFDGAENHVLTMLSLNGNKNKFYDALKQGFGIENYLRSTNFENNSI